MLKVQIQNGKPAPPPPQSVSLAPAMYHRSLDNETQSAVHRCRGLTLEAVEAEGGAGETNPTSCSTSPSCSPQHTYDHLSRDLRSRYSMSRPRSSK